METFANFLLVGMLLTDIVLMSSSRLMHCVKVIALQGLLVGLLPLAAALCEKGEMRTAFILAAINVAVKCVALPLLLSKALRQANIRREVEPFVGYPASILIASALAALSFLLCSRLPLPDEPLSTLAAPVSFSMIGAGLFMIASRRKAITQAIGFLAFENGICVFGAGLLIEQGFLVELGILLDVLALVFVMGIAVFHISKEFDHIDSDKLTRLGDCVAEDSEEPSEGIFHTKGGTQQ